MKKIKRNIVLMKNQKKKKYTSTYISQSEKWKHNQLFCKILGQNFNLAFL